MGKFKSAEEAKLHLVMNHWILSKKGAGINKDKAKQIVLAAQTNQAPKKNTFSHVSGPKPNANFRSNWSFIVSKSKNCLLLTTQRPNSRGFYAYSYDEKINAWVGVYDTYHMVTSTE